MLKVKRIFSSKKNDSLENLIKSNVGEDLQDVGDKSHDHKNGGNVEKGVCDESHDDLGTMSSCCMFFLQII